MNYKKYIHQQDDWPNFRWNEKKIGNLLAKIRFEQGALRGRMETIGFDLRRESMLETYTEDVIKSSEIEGEHLNYDQVRSSIARRLGMETKNMVPASRDVEGVVEMVMDATGNYNKPITDDRLFAWHSLLFPSGRSGFHKIRVGAWREEQMQIISGPIGKEKVHFEAPAPERVEDEMKRFLEWYNEESDLDLVLKSAISHLWFETIHPFDDGNGRIGRALCDLLIARSEDSPKRFYSLSAQIESERTDYYRQLEQSSKGDLDITEWLEWYLVCLTKSIEKKNKTVNRVLNKAKFWDALKTVSINERQRKMLNMLFDGSFFGNLTTTKWAKICKCSQDTAQRDINDLIEKNILDKNPAGGRSTNYSLVDIKLIEE